MKNLWRKFIRWVKQDYSQTSVEYSSHGSEGPELNLNWGIIVPHTKRAGGATTPDSSGPKVNEYEYGLALASRCSFPSETRDIGGVKGAVKRLVKKGVTATIEPHKNAYNGKAKGFEILVLKGDSRSQEVAENIAQEFKKTFPDRVLRGRNGLKIVSPRDRGARNLIDAKKAGAEIALLVESFFIDNPDEWIDGVKMAKFWNRALS